jgi:antitoxin (DNA-binding transcriptional repressor) of toxin-antitoxin stability system
MLHMTTISIRELHQKTGAWVRAVSEEGEILVTDRGEPVATLSRPPVRNGTNPWARRKLSPALRAIMAKAARGTPVDRIIAEDREREAR